MSYGEWTHYEGHRDDSPYPESKPLAVCGPDLKEVVKTFIEYLKEALPYDSKQTVFMRGGFEFEEFRDMFSQSGATTYCLTARMSTKESKDWVVSNKEDSNLKDLIKDLT